MLLNFTLLFYFILFFLLFWFKTDLDSNQQIKYKERESNRRQRLTTSAKIVWKPTANHSKIVRRIPTTARRRWKPQPKTFSFEKKMSKDMASSLEKEQTPTSSFKKSESWQRRLLALPKKETTMAASSEKIIEDSKVIFFLGLFWRLKSKTN